MLPHAAVGGWTPKPRKLMLASAMMKRATCNVPITISGVMMFGRMCRTKMRRLPHPVRCAACTNSFSRTTRVSPRATRAYSIQPAITNVMIMFLRPRPRIALIVSASRMNGKDNWTSTSRIRMTSSQPPK